MKRYHLLIGVVLLLVLVDCTKHPATPLPQENLLYQVEAFWSQKPDSALQILDTLDISVLSEKEQAHYCLLKVQVRDAFFKYDDETDSLLQVAENYFVGGKDKWFEAKTCEALSRIASKEGKGDQVKLDWLLKAYQSVEQCKQVDDRFLSYFSKNETAQELIENYKYKIQMRLGMCYLDNCYYEEGLRRLKPVDSYYAEKQQYSQRFGSANLLGTAYLALKEYDSCKMYLEKGLEAAQEMGQAENVAFYHYSMSSLYLKQFDNQDYEGEEKGRQLLRMAIAECHDGLKLYKESMFRYKEGFYINLSKSYYRLEQYDFCLYYAEKHIGFMNEMHFKMVPNEVNAKAFYRLYKSNEALGNMEKALEYADRYIDMQQALESRPRDVEQVKNEYEKKLEIMQLQNEQRESRLWLYLLLALALLAFVVVLWLGNRYRKNKEIEVLRQKEAYRKLESEFEAASQQSLQALQQRVMADYKMGKDDCLERIMAEFAASYPSAIEKLKTAYPELTESERNIVILSFLGFRSKEEAEILHLSLNTVEKYRTNIRKKANNNPISYLIAH